MAADLTKYIEDNKLQVLLYNGTIMCGIDIMNDFEILYCFVDLDINP